MPCVDTKYAENERKEIMKYNIDWSLTLKSLTLYTLAITEVTELNLL